MRGQLFLRSFNSCSDYQNNDVHWQMKSLTLPLAQCEDSQVFFQCFKPSCLAILSPKTNFVLIQKFQYHTIFNLSDHIDLASFTLFRRGMIMITDSMGFSKHRPSGPMLSISRNVRLSVCPSVRVSVCLFNFEVPFNGLFSPTSRSRMSNIFRDSESLGKSNGKKWSQI